MEANPGPETGLNVPGYNAWFERKVRDSIAAVERGETVPDAEVGAWLEDRH
jgi:hypothetical protein